MLANKKVFFIVLLLIGLGSEVWAANDTNRFEYYKKEYVKLHKNYLKSPNDIASIAALAYFYSEPDNPMRNLPLAMDYIQSSEKKYKDLALDKSKYREVNKLIKKGFTIVELRQRKQFIIDEARKYVKTKLQASEIEAFQKAFPADPIITRQLSLQRSENKYNHALELNSEKAYQEYLNENPNAEGRAEIISRLTKLLTHSLSFAQSENEVDSMLIGYTDPQILQLGAERKIEIDYQKACHENTYDAYRNFLRKHPTSNKYDIVLNTMDTLVANQLKQLKTPSEYCQFALKNSDMPQSEQAVDTLVKMIVEDRNTQALDLYLTHFQNDDNYNDVYKSYYQRFSKEGNSEPILHFKNQNPNFPLPFLIDDDLAAAKKIDKIEVLDVVKENESATYGEYVKKYMKYGVSFVFLQRMIQPLIAKNRWTDALAIMDKYELCFENNNYEDFKALRALLSTNTTDKATQVFTPSHVNILNAYINPSDNCFYFTKRTNFRSQVSKVSIQNNNNSKFEITPVHFNDFENENLQFFSSNETGRKMLVGQNGDIFLVQKIDTSWHVQKSGNDSLNSEFYEGDASFSPDGMGLLIVSDRLGGYNVNLSGMLFHGDTAMATDIYYIPRIGNHFGEAVNLGKNVNSEFSERSPVLSRDLTTLYFTSDRRGGLGYYDIYMCTRTNTNSWTEWSQPINIGTVANTGFSEPTISLSPDESMLYFSSDKSGQYSLYGIPTNHVKGPFYKTLTLNYPKRFNTSNFIVYVIDESNNFLLHQYKYKAGNTSLKFDVFPSKNYIIKCKSPKTFIPILRTKGNTATVNIKAYSLSDAISKKTHIPLPAIIFEENSNTLKKISKTEILHLSKFMEENPDVKIEIINNVNSPKIDLAYELSLNRSNEIKSQLVSNGIDPKRIIASGYGNLNYKNNENVSPVEIIFFTE